MTALNTKLDVFPSDGERFAAIVRALIRNHEAGDSIAVWLTANSLCSKLCFVTADCLATHTEWNPETRWLDGIGSNRPTKKRSLRLARGLAWSERVCGGS
jgi:hypothetical protein